MWTAGFVTVADSEEVERDQRPGNRLRHGPAADEPDQASQD